MGARPVSAGEVAEAVQAHPRVAAVGGGTKRPLVGEGAEIEMSGLTGLTEYEASEYTFTAKAGTPVSEVEEALRAKGQYLPFDPLFAEAGATLGGAVASGLSGPGRFRYGGLRDFLIGVQFVDGHGKLVRSGGKVVKNAAGFDLPKFLVGSLGRFGILTEVSFKVFPAPRETVTLRVRCPDHGAAVERLAEVSSSRWEADALDYEAGERALFLRLGGPGKSLEPLSREIETRWPGEVERLADPAVWTNVREARWSGGSTLVKVPMVPSKIVALEERLESLEGVTSWYSSGGAVAWLALGESSREELDCVLDESGMSGLTVQGEGVASPWIGRRDSATVLSAVKAALDPENRFPDI